MSVKNAVLILGMVSTLEANPAMPNEQLISGERDEQEGAEHYL